MEIESLDSQSSCPFSNEPVEKRPVMNIKMDIEILDGHFESHLVGNGLFVVWYILFWGPFSGRDETRNGCWNTSCNLEGSINALFSSSNGSFEKKPEQ